MWSLPKGNDWGKANEEDITEINECFCPNCEGGNGKTLMLPTKIPGFREIIIATLICQDCGFRNSETTFGGEIQGHGIRITFRIDNTEDLNRQVLKSDSTTLYVPMLDLEIPPGTQKGVITTVEGILRTAKESLSTQQPERLRLGDIDNFYRCKTVTDKIERILGISEDQQEKLEGKTSIFPFDFVLDDPAGNAFLENPHAPSQDNKVKHVKYDRSPTQDMQLGLQPSQTAIQEGLIDDSNPKHKNAANDAPRSNRVRMEAAVDGIGRQEVMKFPTICSHCDMPCETSMCVIDIPYFKECIIMSLNCDHCGFKSNEIKGGGAIPKLGSRIILTVDTQEDLAREVLKSHTAGLEIPSVELELEEGGLDGVYTTVEGLLRKVRERLQVANPFGSGDSAIKQHISNDGGQFSAPNSSHTRFIALLEQLRSMAEGNILPFTLIIKDPLANSFIGPVPKDAVALSLRAEKEGSKDCYDDYVDPKMEIEEFERTFEQNEGLGLNDIKTEGYGCVEYYGTDQMQDVPDRIKQSNQKGQDHPHQVAKAPVEADDTVMGSSSAISSVPSLRKLKTAKRKN